MHHLSQKLELNGINLLSRFQKQAQNVYTGLGGRPGAPPAQPLWSKEQKNLPAVTTQRGPGKDEE